MKADIPRPLTSAPERELPVHVSEFRSRFIFSGCVLGLGFVAFESAILIVLGEAETVECACCGVVVRIEHYRRLRHADEVTGGYIGAVREGIGPKCLTLD